MMTGRLKLSWKDFNSISTDTLTVALLLEGFNNEFSVKTVSSLLKP